MNLSKLSNLQQRIVTGLSGAAILIGGILFSEWTYFVVFLIICLLSLIEFFNILKVAGIRSSPFFGVVAGMIIFIGAFFMEKNMIEKQWSYLLLPLFFSLFIIELFKRNEAPFSAIAYTFLAVIYIALPFALLSVSAYYANYYSSQIVLGILLLLWGNDIGGYIAGMTMGKHKLFLRISPKKTWEGSIGGGILSVLVAIGISFIFPVLSLVQWLILSIILVVFGSYGDLVESLFKRSLAIKDSGSLIPGHGGFLDRFDGLLLASPFIAAYLKLFA